MYCLRIAAFTLFSFTCSEVTAQLQVLQSINSRGQGRTTGTVVVDSTIYGITERGSISVGSNLFAVGLDRPYFEITELPTQPSRPNNLGSLATLDGLIIGSFQPSQSHIYSVGLDATGYRVIANSKDTGLVFVNPIAVGSRIFGSSAGGVFSMNSDGSDFNVFDSEIDTPASAQLVF